MTPTEAQDTLALVLRLFPESDWQPEQIQYFAFQAKRKPIDAEQAKAAVVALSCRHKYAKIKPVEVLAALDGATAQVMLATAPTDTMTKRERNLARDLNLQELPEGLRYEALLRIDGLLNRARQAAGGLSNIGRNLENAAKMAEAGDWIGALEWPLFRAEVKEHAEVAKWIDAQPLKRLDLSQFNEVSTNG